MDTSRSPADSFGEKRDDVEPCFCCHGTGQVSNPMTYNGLGICYVCAGSGRPNPAHPYYRDREARAEYTFGPGETPRAFAGSEEGDRG